MSEDGEYLLQAIRDFTLNEYGDGDDYIPDPYDIGLLYSTIDDDQLFDSSNDPNLEWELQISIDAVHSYVLYYIGDMRNPFYVDTFANRRELAEYIRYMDFNDFYSNAIRCFRADPTRYIRLHTREDGTWI